MVDNDDKIDPVVVSSGIFMEDEGAKTQAAGIIYKVRMKMQIYDKQYHSLNILILFQVNPLKHRLDRLREVMEEEFPGFESLVPSSAGIDAKKLGNGAAISTDTCNTAQKTRRILTEEISGSYDYDCMHHLRNIWIGNMEKKLTKHLNAIQKPVWKRLIRSCGSPHQSAQS